VSPASRHRSRQLVRTVDSEGLTLLLLAFYGVLLAGLAPFELVQDSWLTLVSGREVATHGIPGHETLTLMAHGVQWVDQQWLAQLVFYELVRAGGLRLAVLVHVLLLVSALGLALATARRLGASANAVFWIGLVCVFLAPWGWQLRAQSFAYPLFAGALALLVADSRSPSRKVLWVLPLLVLWGNLHGSVILGAALVALRGVTIFWTRARGVPEPHWALRGSLLCAAPLAALVSPYGVHLVGYYHHMLGSPLLSTFVQEWGPTTPQKAWLFYALALAALWLLGRAGSALTVFERLALLASIGAALTSIRQVVWFELAAAALLPALIAAWRGTARRAIASAWVSRLAIGVGLVTAVALLAAPARWYQQHEPTAAETAIARTTASPATKVFASETLSDWLLWTDPALRGRVAYDVRFEILTRHQLQELVDYHHRTGPAWAAPTNGYGVLVLDRHADRKVVAALEREPGLMQVYADRKVVVLRRT
jgi:hypothetical protein